MCRHEFGRLSESTCHLQDFAEVVRTVKERHKHQPGALRVDEGAPIFGAAELLRRAEVLSPLSTSAIVLIKGFTAGRESTDAPLQANARMENPPFFQHFVVEMRNYHLLCYVMFTEE